MVGTNITKFVKEHNWDKIHQHTIKNHVQLFSDCAVFGHMFFAAFDKCLIQTDMFQENKVYKITPFRNKIT